MESMIVKGGWMMVPILFGSVAALALVLERLWYFWSISLDTKRFSDRVFALVEMGDLKEAHDVCVQTNHPLAAVFQTGLEHAGEDIDEIERVMEREGNRQIQKVEQNLNLLLVVTGVEPLLGFLGTILGLIRAFMSWERLGAQVTVSALAAGIYQAMITTAAGLIIAIPYYVIYHVFLGHVNAVSREIMHFCDEMVSALKKGARGKKG